MSWVVILIVGVVLLALVVVSSQKLARQSPQDLDLTSVRNAMREKHGWTIERAYAAELEYTRFLTLLQMRPGFPLVPWLDSEGRDDLDQFWHQHILDTAKYAADCKGVFGRMIHHNPHLVRGSEEEQESIDKTRRLYARRFGSGTYGSQATAADFSGCSACSTLGDSGHSAHGSSGGHSDSGSHSGGDGGGHSCGGGHGCGSSCGSGCGGH